MFRVNGLYGHGKRNGFYSTVMFGGFLLASRLVGGFALFPWMLARDPEHAWFSDFPAYLLIYGPLVTAAGAVLFLGRFVLHVRTLRGRLKFRYVERWEEQRLVNMVETLAINEGLPLPKAGVIEGRALNAFACGLNARTAVIVVTRGLLQELDDKALETVIAHQIMHIKNADIRLLAAAGVLMDNVRVLQTQNPLRIKDARQVVLAILVPPMGALFVISAALTFLALTLARCCYFMIAASRQFVADAEAVRITHDPASLIAALRRIGDRHALEGMTPGADAMMFVGADTGPFATHPAITARFAVLTRLTGPMAYDTRGAAGAMALDPAMEFRRRAFGRKGLDAPVAAQNPKEGFIPRVLGALCAVRLHHVGWTCVAAGVVWAWHSDSRFGPARLWEQSQQLIALSTNWSKAVSSGDAAPLFNDHGRPVPRRPDAVQTVPGGEANAGPGLVAPVVLRGPAP